MFAVYTGDIDFGEVRQGVIDGLIVATTRHRDGRTIHVQLVLAGLERVPCPGKRRLAIGEALRNGVVELVRLFSTCSDWASPDEGLDDLEDALGGWLLVQRHGKLT